MTPGGQTTLRYRDPRSDPRSGSKAAYGPSYESSSAGSGLDNGGNWESARRNTKTPETPLPELPDMTPYAQFCCRKAYEDVAGWMGSILERQVCIFLSALFKFHS